MPEGGLRGLGGGAGDNELRLPEPPKFPKEVLDRFPALKTWQSDFEDFLKKFARAIKRT